MESDTLSIIIPCKDRAENTKKLLNELCRQKKDYPQTEIIVIENCCTEDMPFLDDYDIIHIKEDNEGVSYARNRGLEIFKGNYLCFIDNDDMVAGDYLATIYANLKLKKDWYVWQWMCDDTVVTMDDLDIKHPLKKNWALWGYCFKRELWENVRFPYEKKAGEDLIIFGIITEQTKGFFIKKVMYRFTWNGNENSLSHRHNRGEI